MFRNMRLKSRMLLSYMMISVICLTASITALIMLRKIGNNLSVFYNNNYAVTVSVWSARREMQSARADILMALLEADEDEARTSINKASSSLSVMRATFPMIRSTFKGDLSLVDQVDSLLQQAIVYRDQIFDLIESGQREKAFSILKSDYVPLLDQMADTLQQIADTAGRNAQKMVEEGRSAQKWAVAVVTIIIILSILTSMLLSLYISNRIRGPIEEIEYAAQKVAGGELDASLVTYTSRDELGRLSDSIRDSIISQKVIIEDIGKILGAMSRGSFIVKSDVEESYKGQYSSILMSMRGVRKSLNSILRQIRMSVEQVSNGSEQMSSGAQVLSAGAADQANSIEALASAIDSLSLRVKETADNAADARVLTNQAGDRVSASSRQMQEMMAAMEEISDKSNQISKIIKTIEDISFQTNILALNASVEAARGGSSGKGFAVVADEIRDLANKTSEASKNTAVLVEGTVRAVQDGRRIAGRTAESLVNVVKSTRQIEMNADKIASATEQQNKSIVQITSEMRQISSVVQTNSAMSEELAAASEELSSQAQILESITGRFELGDDR